MSHQSYDSVISLNQQQQLTEGGTTTTNSLHDSYNYGSGSIGSMDGSDHHPNGIISSSSSLNESTNNDTSSSLSTITNNNQTLFTGNDNYNCSTPPPPPSSIHNSTMETHHIQFYYNISQITNSFFFKINYLEGNLSHYFPKISNDLIIECHLCYPNNCSTEVVNNNNSEVRDICVPSFTSQKKQKWDEFIHFPIRYFELPSNAKICFTIYDVYSPNKKVIIGSCCLPLFGRKGRLRTGKYRVKLFIRKEIKEIFNEEYKHEFYDDELQKIEKLETNVKTNFYYLNQMSNHLNNNNQLLISPRNSTVNNINLNDSLNILKDNDNCNYHSWLDKFTIQKKEHLRDLKLKSNSKDIFLNIELPIFDHRVIDFDYLANNTFDEVAQQFYKGFPNYSFNYSNSSNVSRNPVGNDLTNKNNNKSNTNSQRQQTKVVNNSTVGGTVTTNNASSNSGVNNGTVTTNTGTNVVVTNNVTSNTTNSSVVVGNNNTSNYNNTDEDHFRFEFCSKEAFQFIDDPEARLTNLAEEKHLKLSINLSSGLCDTNLKPNALETKKIQKILDYPPLHEIPTEDKSLLWRYRYYLRSNKRALIKFLRCVDWNYLAQKKEAEKLIGQWSEIETVDALSLLSRFFKNVKIVRDYAVEILRKSNDEEILDVLLQLVQALRYELDNSNIRLHECELAKFLLERAQNNFYIANNLNWYLSVETEDPKYGEHFSELRHKFFIHLKKYSPVFLEKLIRQGRMVDTFSKIGNYLMNLKLPRPEKIVNYKKILSAKGPIPNIQFDNGNVNYTWTELFLSAISKNYSEEPLPLPLAPDVKVDGLFPDDSTIFKSAKSPMLVPFKDSLNEKYNVIFKIGDDLRQDQLVMQLILLMDKLLKNNGLDLKLTPYPVLAFSPTFGCLKCVTPSSAISSVIAKGDIRGWLRKHNTEDEDFHNACQNFVKSCAGYCVITYILGIGDRHLDNVLITPQGLLFHIDFGFILGRDPKPFPPPMKLCKEMVEGMGGSKSEGYTKFKEYCVTAYNILRKSAHLIINMFVLMADANIPDIEHGGVDALKNIMKVQEKFKLELNDQEANVYMQSIINESERALFPQLMENIHRWAQYWRA
ncbi:hypothetical protein ABK040_005673 [Willaertia magna]